MTVAACKFVFVWFFCRSFGKLLACVAHNFRARHKFSHTHTRTYGHTRTHSNKSRIWCRKGIFGKWRVRYMMLMMHSHALVTCIRFHFHSQSILHTSPPAPIHTPQSPALHSSYQFKFRSIDHTATQTYSYNTYVCIYVSKYAHTLHLLRDRCLHSHSAFQAKACVKCKLLKKYQNNTLAQALSPFPRPPSSSLDSARRINVKMQKHNRVCIF